MLAIAMQAVADRHSTCWKLPWKVVPPVVVDATGSGNTFQVGVAAVGFVDTASLPSFPPATQSDVVGHAMSRPLKPGIEVEAAQVRCAAEAVAGARSSSAPATARVRNRAMRRT